MNVSACIDRVDPLAPDCPSRQLLDLIGDRWSLLVMMVVGQGVRRNGEMKRMIGGISQKMLTQTLRLLEAHGLVQRHDFQTVPPHVEYELTPLGHSLRAAMQPLHDWVETRFDEVQAARAAFAA
jgi:DNA-binding HxlR family transcriptional regulator